MEQIKRANRLYTNDSIFLKKSLSIPVLSDSDAYSNVAALAEEDSGDGTPNENSGKVQKDGEEGESELSPMDFLKRMDGFISQSKQAAVKGCQESEKRYTLFYFFEYSQFSLFCPFRHASCILMARYLRPHYLNGDQ